MTNAAPAYSVGESLRWFAAAYAIALIANALAMFALAAVDIELSALSSSLIGLAIFGGIVFLAGSRFEARRPDWDESTRHALALGYMLTSWLVSALHVAFFYAVLFPELAQEAFGPVLQMPALVVAVCVGLSVASYVVARTFLHDIVWRRRRQKARPS